MGIFGQLRESGKAVIDNVAAVFHPKFDANVNTNPPPAPTGVHFDHPQGSEARTETSLRLSPRTKSPNSPAVDRYLESWSDEHDSNDEHVVVEITTASDPLSVRSEATRLLPPSGPDEKFKRKSSHLSPAERRTLGLAEKTPDDATVILDPMSGNFRQHVGRQKFGESKGLKPVDTLSSVKKPNLGRADYMYIRTRKLDGRSSRSRDTQSIARSQQDDEHRYPNKRPRIDRSPKQDVRHDTPIVIDVNSSVGSPDPLVEVQQMKATSESSPYFDAAFSASVSAIPSLRHSPDNLERMQPERSLYEASEQGHQSTVQRTANSQLAVGNSTASGAQVQSCLILADQTLASTEANSPPHRLDTRLGNRSDAKQQIRSAQNEQRQDSKALRRLPSFISAPQRRLRDDDQSSDELSGASTVAFRRAYHKSENPSRETAGASFAIARKGLTYFKLDNFTYAHIPTSSGTFFVDERDQSWGIKSDYEELASDPIVQRPINHISTIVISGGNTAQGAFLKLRGGGDATKLCLVFDSTRTLSEFGKKLASLNSNLRDFKQREEQWLLQAFTRTQEEAEFQASRRRNDRLNRLPRASSSHNDSTNRETQLRRSVNSTRAYDTTYSSTPVISNNNKIHNLRMVNDIDVWSASPSEGAARNLESFPNLQEQSKYPSLHGDTRRSTRSTAPFSQINEATPRLPNPEIDKVKSEWRGKALVYPPRGRRRETVQPDDLDRLEDDEFLNDSLIGLFLLYLFSKAQKAQQDRMHMFNSFFLEALSKDSNGKKGFNYRAVSGWTKNFNLFNRDFVVVPVNENLHWFVMIICNLPWFKKSRMAGEDELNEISSEEFSIVENVHDDQGQADTASPVLPESERQIFEAKAATSFEDLTLDGPASSEGHKTSSLAGTRRGRKGKRAHAPRRYDVDKPIIITLDSLNLPRSQIASTLRSYLAALADDAAQPAGRHDIDKSEIKGMTARGIPHQSNYSDCGIYLCMYIEQFMYNSDVFLRRILQGEQTDRLWPSHIDSRQLRTRFLRVLRELHRQQRLENYQPQLPPLGSVLVDMEAPIAILTPQPSIDSASANLLPFERPSTEEVRREWENRQDTEPSTACARKPTSSRDLALQASGRQSEDRSHFSSRRLEKDPEIFNPLDDPQQGRAITIFEDELPHELRVQGRSTLVGEPATMKEIRESNAPGDPTDIEDQVLPSGRDSPEEVTAHTPIEGRYSSRGQPRGSRSVSVSTSFIKEGSGLHVDLDNNDNDVRLSTALGQGTRRVKYKSRASRQSFESMAAKMSLKQQQAAEGLEAVVGETEDELSVRASPAPSDRKMGKRAIESSHGESDMLL